MSAPSDLEPKFRVAICGAGISGLVLAITIRKYDPSIPIDIYEAHSSIETTGAGIAVRKQTIEVMMELGLFDELKQIFTLSPDNSLGPGPSVRRSDIREGGYPLFQRAQYRAPATMHRQHVVAILESHVSAWCKVHHGKRLVNYVEPERQDAHSTSPIMLNFADGTSATADVLVGADGIRSAVRECLFEAASKDKNDSDDTDLKQYVKPTFTGITLYRCLVPAGMLKEENPEHRSLTRMTMYLGKGKYCVTYPIAKGTLVNVVAFKTDPSMVDTCYEGNWVCDGSGDNLVEFFDDFEPDARAVVKLCEKPSKWALHVVKPLPFCVRKRVALIGDACHAMAPHLGAGAAQAIDDAFILGRLIGHSLTVSCNIQDALRIYEETRFPVARFVASLSLSTGWLYSFMTPGYYDGARREDDLDDKGISAYEREGMESIKQEILRRFDIMDDEKGALQVWRDAELMLQALANY